MARGAAIAPPVAAVASRRAPVATTALARSLSFVGSVALAGGFGVVYAYALLLRHAEFNTYAFDLGLLAQVAWNSGQGQLFANTLLAFNYLADHCSPVLALLGPLLRLWPDVRLLLVLQATAVAAAGIGVYAVARARGAGRPAALGVQLAYLLAPTTAWVALDEFHPIALALPILTAATALLWQRRYGWAAAVAALALLTSEDAASWLIPFGVFVALLGRRAGWKPGLALSFGAAAWIALYFFVVVPALRPPDLAQANPHPDIGVFVYCGKTWSEVASCLVTHPQKTLEQVLRPGGQTTLRDLLTPSLGFGLLGPSLLVAAPRWLVQLISVGPGNDTGHYVALLAPATFLAAAEVVGWLSRRRRWLGGAAAALLVLFGIVNFHRQAPVPGGAFALPGAQERAAMAELDAALRLVPDAPRVSVTSTSSFLPHLALRSRVYLPWADPRQPVDYRVLNLADAYPLDQQQLAQLVRRWRADPRYTVTFDQDNLVVFAHRPDPPTRPAEADFGGLIRFDGDTSSAADGKLRLRLYWTAERTMPVNYHYFVHLVDAQGKGFSQQDGEPIGGLEHTSAWSAGQPVADTIVLPAPDPALWSRYHLEIGWYDATTGARLILPDGQNYVRLPLPAL